jgi:hypothetical protein
MGVNAEENTEVMCTSSCRNPRIPGIDWKEHFEWIKRWNRHYKIATKSRYRPNKTFSGKLLRKIRCQTHAVRRLLYGTDVITVVLDEGSDYDEEWCDECFERNCEAHMRDI